MVDLGFFLEKSIDIHQLAILKLTSRVGMPYLAVALYGPFMALGYMTLSSSASTVCKWI